MAEKQNLQKIKDYFAEYSKTGNPITEDVINEQVGGLSLSNEDYKNIKKFLQSLELTDAETDSVMNWYDTLELEEETPDIGVEEDVVAQHHDPVRADDILASNPWWATNSGFKIAFHNSLIEPYPIGEDGALSFPEIFSRLAATHTRFQTPPLNDSRDWLLDSWGFDRYNTRKGQLFTFEDWIAEMVRSNLVLTTAPSATNIDEELYLSGYDTDTTDTITNTPLPEYSLPSQESIPEAKDVLAQGERTVTSFIQSLPQPGTGGDPEIVLIPEFSVGGIHVREYRASLSSPIVPTCHAVLSFLYAVGLACFVFKMAKAEYVYYASIGRQWGRYD